jgi:hypothetical protein
VRVPAAGAIDEQAHRLPDALRVLPERVRPVEIAPSLGGAVLRSHPDDMVNREYFEVRTNGQEVTVERHRGDADGREQVPFTVTREQLGRMVDDLGRAMGPKDG